MKLINEKTLIKDYVPVSRTTIWRMVTDGQFPAPIKLRGLCFWKIEDIQKWYNEQSSETTGEATL